MEVSHFKKKINILFCTWSLVFHDQVDDQWLTVVFTYVCSNHPIQFDYVPEKLEVSLKVSKPGLGEDQKSLDCE
jgi:hypothetical protein